MFRILTLVFVVTTAISGWSQRAVDYLNRDKNVSIFYKTYRGDTIEHRFTHQQVYEEDTVCFYQRLNMKGDSIGVVYYAYNKNVLIKGNYLVNKHFKGPTELDLVVSLPVEQEKTDTSYILSFDMDVSQFEQSAHIERKYQMDNGKKFKKVLVVDQHNLTDEFHYISLFAPGIGLINQGKDELLFLWKAKTKPN